MNLDFKSPIFVVGPPRSGTTLLQRLLIEEFCVTAVPESHFYSQLLSYLNRVNGLLELDPVYLKNKLGVDINSELVVGETRREVFECYISRLVRSYDQLKTLNPRVLEKTPGHAFCTKTILEDFQDAIIVFILRDPIPSILSSASYFPASKSKKKSIDQAIAYWLSCVTPFASHNSNKNIISIRYEELIKDPVECVHQIGLLANLKRRDILPDTEQIKKSIAISFETWKGMSFDNVSEKNIKKYRFMDRFAGIYIDMMTNQLREYFGYHRGFIYERALLIPCVLIKIGIACRVFVSKLRDFIRRL